MEFYGLLIKCRGEFEEMNDHTEVIINEIPLCDFCLQEGDKFPASFDCKTNLGCWAKGHPVPWGGSKNEN